jgi:hypothetical protein
VIHVITLLNNNTYIDKYIPTNTLSSSFIILQIILWILFRYRVWESFIAKQTYLWFSNEDTTKKMLNKLIRDIENKEAFELGSREFVYNRYVPKCIISIKHTYIVYTRSNFVGMSSLPNIEIDMYTPRWLTKYINDSIKSISKTSEIFVIENTDLRYTLSEEIVYSSHINPEIIKTCNKCVSEIHKNLIENDNFSKIYILQGKTGCGKSTTARILTKAINGMLYSEYNPTRQGDSVWVLQNDLAYHEKPFVFVIEEFDIVLTKVVNEVLTEKKKQNVDILDKISWNNFFDKIKKRKNIVMILTTNCSIKQLTSICNGDESFLRKNRIDGVFQFRNDDVEFLSSIF